MNIEQELKRGRFQLSVNITMRCNTVCQHCCRGIGAMDWRHVPDMTVEQATKLADVLVAHPVEVRKIKIAGGEPLLHKDLIPIVEQFLRATVKVMVLTNGMSKNLPRLPAGARWKVDHIDWKAHTPFFASPVDMGLEDLVDPVRHCHALKHCVGVENEGFTPCSVARTMSRALGHDELEYVTPMPSRDPPMNICRHCPFSLPKAKQQQLEDENVDVPTESFINVKKEFKIIHLADNFRRPNKSQEEK